MPNRGAKKPGLWSAFGAPAALGQTGTDGLSGAQVLPSHRVAAIRIANVFRGLSIKTGVVHRSVPFVQHPSENQHLGLWERGVLHCLPVPLG